MGSENVGSFAPGTHSREKGGKGVCPGGRGGCKGGVVRAETRGHTCCAVPLPARWSWRIDALHPHDEEEESKTEGKKPPTSLFLGTYVADEGKKILAPCRSASPILIRAYRTRK